MSKSIVHEKFSLIKSKVIIVVYHFDQVFQKQKKT